MGKKQSNNKDRINNTIENLRIGTVAFMTILSGASFSLTMARAAECIKEPDKAMVKLLILPISLFVWSTPIAVMLYDNFKKDAEMGLLSKPHVRSRNN